MCVVAEPSGSDMMGCDTDTGKRQWKVGVSLAVILLTVIITVSVRYELLISL